MTLKDYQEKIDTKLQVYEKPYWHPLSQLARIIEEVGEVARELNDRYGDKPKKPTEASGDLGDELADVLFSVICLANNEHIDLDSSLQKVMLKLDTRDKDRFKKKQ